MNWHTLRFYQNSEVKTTFLAFSTAAEGAFQEERLTRSYFIPAPTGLYSRAILSTKGTRPWLIYTYIKNHKPNRDQFPEGESKKILDQFKAKCWLRGGVGGQFPRNLNHGEVPLRAPTPYPLLEKVPLFYTFYNRHPFYTSTFMDKSFGSFLHFGGVFNSHMLNPYPSPQAKLDACIQNFSEFELCRGWGEGELQENFEMMHFFGREPSNDRKL